MDEETAAAVIEIEGCTPPQDIRTGDDNQQKAAVLAEARALATAVRNGTDFTPAVDLHELAQACDTRYLWAMNAKLSAINPARPYAQQ